ncbi:hypothetical protein ACFLS9_07175 [Bacteroidota bacterium]
MKKMILFLILIGFFISSCFNNDIVSPEEPVIEKTSSPNWITLPESSEKSLEKEFSKSQWVFHSYGGTIGLYKLYWSWSHGWVSINASISFDREFYDKDLYGSFQIIKLTVDDNTCSSTFSPRMDFLKPATYNIKYTGLNLSNVDLSNVDFVYQAEDGSVEYLQYESINVDAGAGVIEVVNAKIPHFSRFGFVN